MYIRIYTCMNITRLIDMCDIYMYIYHIYVYMSYV